MKILSLLLLLPTLYFLFSITFVNAAGLVPCGGHDVDGNLEPECNFCFLLQMIKDIIYKALEFIAIPIAVIMIAYGAFNIMFAMGNEEKAKKGRQVIQAAVFGAVIVLAAWVIVNTVINILADQSKFPWPWNQLPC